jgi:hypothetical protein
LVPAGINPITDGIPRFSYKSSQEEDRIEMDRLHAVIHPDCYNRLIEDLGFTLPEQRLEVPRFFLRNIMNNTAGPSGDQRRHSPSLSEAELSSIKAKLQEDAAQRKKASAGLRLRVVVDGVERATLDLSQQRSALFALASTAELIEVRSQDMRGGDLLLATHLLSPAEPDEAIKRSDASIVLEGGQRLTFAISPTESHDGAVVAVTYRETNPFKAAAAFLTRLTQTASVGLMSHRSWHERKILTLTLECAVLALGAAVLISYAVKWRPSARQPLLTTNEQVSQPASEDTRASPTATQTGGAVSTLNNSSAEQANHSSTQVAEARQPRESNENSSASQEIARNDKPQQRPLVQPQVVPEEAVTTRSITPATTVTSLAGVKKIYIEVLGDGLLSKNVHELLRVASNSSGRLTLAQNRDEADALLKVSVAGGSAAETEHLIIVTQLINARGEVIWPHTNTSGKYQGSAANVADSLMKDLLNSIRQAERQR